jgi:hypothetical protein
MKRLFRYIREALWNDHYGNAISFLVFMSIVLCAISLCLGLIYIIIEVIIRGYGGWLIPIPFVLWLLWFIRDYRRWAKHNPRPAKLKDYV